MNLIIKNSRGRPPSRCSIFRIASLLTPKGTQTTPTIFTRAVNSSNHRAARNTHLKMSVRPEFIQSDEFYENTIEALNGAKDKSGWQETSFVVDHAQDRFDCVLFGLDALIEEYREKNANNPYFDPYEDLARELDWTENGLFGIAKSQRAAPRKVLDEVRSRVANLAGADPNRCKVEQLPTRAREYPPLHAPDRAVVMKMFVK